MSLSNSLLHTISLLRALNPRPAIVENYVFVLEDIQKTLENPDYEPHLHGPGFFGDPRGEGCYTKLGYHATFMSFNDIQPIEAEALPAYHAFYAFIDEFHSLHNTNDPRLSTYDSLLQGYQARLLKPINDLDYAHWRENGRVGLIAETEHYIERLKQYPSTYATLYQSILMQFKNHLIDSRHVLEIESIQAQLAPHQLGNEDIISPPNRDDLPALLLFDDYIKSLKSDYPDTSNETIEHWGTLYALINRLHDYRLNVIQNAELPDTVKPGLLSKTQAVFLRIQPTNEYYAQLQQIVTIIRQEIGDAVEEWITERDKVRRHQAAKRDEEKAMTTLFLCCIHPLMGGCFMCCDELVTEAELKRLKAADERDAAQHIAFLSLLENGLNHQTLSYNDLQFINNHLEDFKQFVSHLPKIKKVEGRFYCRFIDWVCNVLNSLFDFGIESPKIKNINRQLTFFQSMQPTLQAHKRHVEEDLKQYKRDVLQATVLS